MTELPISPWGVAITPDAIWVAGGEPGAIQRVDTVTGVICEVASAQRPFLAVAGRSYVWISDNLAGGLIRIDPRDDSVFVTPSVAAGPWAIAAGDATLWLSDHPSDTIVRLDPDTCEVMVRAKTDGWPACLLHAFGALWSVSWKDATLCAYDEWTGALQRRISLGDVPGPSAIAASNHHLWVTHVGLHSVLQVDPYDGRVGDPIAVGKAPWCLAVHREQVCIASTDSSSISVIDCASRKVTRTWEGVSFPYGIAADDQAVWVGLRRPAALARFPWT